MNESDGVQAGPVAIIVVLTILYASGAQGGGPLFTDLAAGAHDARIVTSNPAGMTRLEQPSWRTGIIGVSFRRASKGRGLGFPGTFAV